MRMDNLGDSDDDGCEKKFNLASGKKRRHKKMKRRICYNPYRTGAHFSFASSCVSKMFMNSELLLDINTLHS
jgi:hypothetical protein